jgi:hypothetical protein
VQYATTGLSRHIILGRVVGALDGTRTISLQLAMDPPTYIAGMVAGLLALVMLKRRIARRTLPLPPGPKPLPIIGNLLDMPKEKEWLTYRAWNNQYGDVVCVDVLGQKVVILGSASAVRDLMEQRGNIYSDRATTSMIELYVLLRVRTWA